MAKVGTIQHELDKVARMLIDTHYFFNENNTYISPYEINMLSNFIKSFFQYDMIQLHYIMVADLYPDLFTVDQDEYSFYINTDHIPDDLM